MFTQYLSTFFYSLLGICMAIAGIEAIKDKSNSARIGTGFFWFILALLFIFGDLIPKPISGALVLVLGLLSLFKQVKVGKIAEIDASRASKYAKKLGIWLFLPSIVLALSAILVGSLTDWGGQIAIGIGAVLALIVAIFETRAPIKLVYNDTQRMFRTMGTAGMLPQMLAMLGSVFTAAGVGTLVAKAVSGAFPTGNKLLGVTLYCVAMALFTIIMGNAFAAFAVITAAIGVPFVIAQGGSPVVVATLGMTAGYCGTLVTPMAANFNSLPVAFLEMKDQWGVIKQQLPIAVILLVLHIILMYVLAF